MRVAVPLLLGLSVLVVAASGRAQPLENIFARANQAYVEGRYEAAIRDYELLVQAGVDDPDVSYDLGTANGRLGRYGHAVRWFEHALRLSPGDDDAQRGLAEARRGLEQRQARRGADAEVVTEPTFAESLVRPISEAALAWLLLVVNTLFFGLLVVRRFVRSENGRLALGIALPIVGLLLLASGAALVVKTDVLAAGPPGIVVAPEAELREGPDPRAAVRAHALEGERARIVESDGDFTRIQLGARDGWVPNDAVAPL